MRPSSMTRVLDELFWRVRREGVAISTAQAIDAARAALLVGLDDREIFRETLACVVTQSAVDRRRFTRAFDDFFAARKTPDDFWDRLESLGFTANERDVLRELLDSVASVAGDGNTLGPLLERGAALDRLLKTAAVERTMQAMQSPMQAGFFSHKTIERVGITAARSALAALRVQLRDALGARGDALADALEAELAAAADDVRAHVQRSFSKREEDQQARGNMLEARPFTSLTDAEVIEVRRAVRRFAERLRGGERVRRHRALRGRLDPRATMRKAFATGGVPIHLVRKSKRRERARLFLLCDVSDSVRAAARFMLEFVYFAHELFDKTRSFVFVSDIKETTELFERETVEVALARAYGGSVVPVQNNSNYGRVLRTFEENFGRDIDRRATVVILGDGRTNYHADATDSLARIRERASSVIWLCPEPRQSWSFGDSAMARYAKVATTVLEVTCAAELEDAARLISRSR
ncbi:MAG: VWA domain-containing protein [Polyangiaceae bacterium]